MRGHVKIGEATFVAASGAPPTGYVLYDGPDIDPTTTLIVWDDGIQNIRAATAQEVIDKTLANLRQGAKAHLDQPHYSAALLRSALIETLLYVRDAHANLNTLLDGIAGAANLGQVKSAAAAITQSPAPANNSLFLTASRAAIKARIDNGEADT